MNSNNDLKKYVKFHLKEVELLERIFIAYIDTLDNQYEAKEVERLLKHLYKDSNKILARKVRELEKLGYKVEKEPES